jgi:leucyl/phenylalanyl-tRNA--protein transferase
VRRGGALRPAFLAPGSAPWFPDPRRAGPDGLVAVGGDLAPDRLRLAYASGIFPWFDEQSPILWWSPDPRGVLPAADVHVARSLARRIRKGGFELTWNRAFADVMRACGEGRADGTWILPEMIAAYVRLHEQGSAHSLEVWTGGELVAGLYGVQVGGLFAAESMFHRERDLSKVAQVAAVRSLARAGVGLFEVQFVTGHLASLGAVAIPRADYLARLQREVARRVELTGLSVAT